MTYNKKTSQGTHLFIEALPPVHVVQNTQQSNKPTQPRIGWPPHHTTGVHVPTLFEQSCGFFNFPQEPDECKSCETEPYSFLSLSRKTRNSNCLQMSLQRQHFPSQLFKDPKGWSGRGLYPRPPTQQTSTLPTELI